MIEVMTFIFDSFWHWLGTLIILMACASVVAALRGSA